MAISVIDKMSITQFRLNPIHVFGTVPVIFRDLADNAQIIMKFSPKYYESYISKMMKGSSSKLLRKKHPHFKKWCGDYLRVSNCYHGYVDNV